MMEKMLGVFILATMLAVPTMASAAGQVPAEFIAVSDSHMNWNEAKAWCKRQGGRLPVINGAASQSWGQIAKPKTAIIDGFGQIATGLNGPDWTTPWPSGLPSDYYWTGTRHTDRPGHSWLVSDVGGSVNVGGTRQDDPSRRVICVP